MKTKNFLFIMIILLSSLVMVGAVESMYIDANGNVGIGTVSPEAKLDVDGYINMIGASQLSGDVQGKKFYVGSFNNPTGSYYGFSTSNSHHLAIDVNTGNVGIGTVSPSAKLHVNGKIRATEFETAGGNLKLSGSGWGVDVLLDVDGGSSDAFTIKDTGVNKLVLVGNSGDLWIAGALTQRSDIRYKKDVTTIDDALNKIMQLRGVNYKWKDENNNNSVQMGVIAQDVEKVFPELVFTDKDGYKSVSYTNMIGVLIESIKELKLQNDELKNRIKVLE